MGLAGAILAAAPSAAALASFHPARTAPEQALDKALRFVDADDLKSQEWGKSTAQPVKAEQNLANILALPAANGRKDYERYLTPKLVAHLPDMQKSAVQSNCGGKYLPDALCGLEYDPVGCHQFFAEHYAFRTVSQDRLKARIEFADIENTAGWGVVTYDLVKSGISWRIDAIKCPD